MNTPLTAAAELLDARRRAAETVNSSITLSVKWHVVRRTGRATGVGHIQLNERLQSGNFRRRVGDLLCGARSASVEVAEERDSAGQVYSMEVTCKACLARARLLSNWVELSKLE